MMPRVLAMTLAKQWRLLLRAAAYLASAAYLLSCLAPFNMVCADPPGEPSLVRNSPLRVSDPNPSLPPSSNVQPVAAWNSIPPRRDSGNDPANGSVTTGAVLRKSEQQPLELKGPGTTEDPRVKAPRSPWAATLSMTLSLTLVVCLFLIAALMLRKSQPKQFQKLPNEVIEVLGRSTMGPRQQLFVLRFGRAIGGSLRGEPSRKHLQFVQGSLPPSGVFLLQTASAKTIANLALERTSSSPSQVKHPGHRLGQKKGVPEVFGQ